MAQVARTSRLDFNEEIRQCRAERKAGLLEENKGV